MTWIAYVLAGLMIILAAWILIKRTRDFIQTKGRSACENCPYSGQCAGPGDDCRKKSGG